MCVLESIGRGYLAKKQWVKCLEDPAKAGQSASYYPLPLGGRGGGGKSALVVCTPFLQSDEKNIPRQTDSAFGFMRFCLGLL